MVIDKASTTVFRKATDRLYGAKKTGDLKVSF
jgi:hypothetical protein